MRGKAKADSWPDDTDKPSKQTERYCGHSAPMATAAAHRNGSRQVELQSVSLDIHGSKAPHAMNI